MRFRVRITARAESDAERAFWWIAEREASTAAANRWLIELERAVAALEIHPLRFPRAPEAAVLDLDVRQLLHHSHRVLFVVEGEHVLVIHIRHASRLPAAPADLEG